MTHTLQNLDPLFSFQGYSVNPSDSTNNYASGLIDDISTDSKKNGIENGTIIIAKEQTLGRGQAENIWESEKDKNLTLSIILFPKFLNADRQFMLSKVISLALTDFVKNYAANVKIKWPNDIMLGQKKIGGILIQNSLCQNSISDSIVGIGLNVNQTEFENYCPSATSVKSEIGIDLNLDECLKMLCFFIDRRYQQLVDGEFEYIDNEYLSNLFQFQQFRLYKSKGEFFTAKIIGVENMGNLILETEVGERLFFAFKEVGFVF